MYEDLLYGFYSLPFKFSGKVLPVILILLFFSFILYMPTRIFLSGANKKPFKSKNSIGRKCSQLKVLKVLLMHLFVTLLINKITDADNRKRLSQDPLFKVHLNKSQSQFKFILLLSGDINLNLGPTAAKRNDKNYGNFSLSSTVVFLLSGWVISLILYLQLAMTHETYFRKETCTSFI